MKRQKQLTNLLTAAAAALCLAACNSDELPGDEPGNDGATTGAATVTVRFASAPAATTDASGTPSTRTTIGGDNGYDVLWTTTDKIGISAVPAEGTEAKTVTNKLYYPATAGASSAFTPNYGSEMSLTAGTSYQFYSYYPQQQSNITDNGKTVGFTLAAAPSADDAADSKAKACAADFMWATKTAQISGANAPQISFTYGHAFTMLRFGFTNTGSKTIQQIIFRDPAGTAAVSGKAGISLADGTVTPTNGYTFAQRALTLTTAAPADETLWMPVFPQTAGIKFEICVLTGDNSIYVFEKTTPDGGLAAGTIYNITLDFSTVTAYTAPATEKNAYKITSPADLRWLALLTNIFGVKADAQLATDISLSGFTSWEPIGTSANPYQGTFDGRNHTITGLTITADAAPTYNVGLFGTISGATVKNIRLDGVSITATNSAYVGGIAGTANSNTISGCLVSGTITGSRNVGGIAGYNSATITDCYTTATVSATVYYAGGIAGANSGAITRCYSSATVSAKDSRAGGIAGETYGSNAAITHCYATGTVTSGTRTGGIAGHNYSGATITGCIALNAGISSTLYYGRIAGLNAATIAGCYAYENIPVKEGNRLQNITGGTTDNVNGKALTATECHTAATYTAAIAADGMGWSEAEWSFSPGSPWTYLPCPAEYGSLQYGTASYPWRIPLID